ncbi:MAG: cytidine deaminase [Bacillota bacterium]|jgi:cytidine deaminase|nr:cytidine deaminase [Bacillota bacterium]MDD3298767.1 cytidine deaminase [Bacillota bacterium]MDD3850386.1 cytidine deaminase [Bacillota bacterium]MDD4708013.1 cytidine deaminase [Bacillota bacterium]
MDYRKLLALAEEAKEHSYSPYSGFRVGAAILSTDGKVITGTNVESATYGATVCAERAAVVRAVSEGYRDFEAIAVASDAEGGSFPCGICRQFLAEFGLGIKVITGKPDGDIKVNTVAELLPFSFTGEELQKRDKQ